MKSKNTSSINANFAVWIPAITAAIYPWIFDAFHLCVTPSASANLSVEISAGSTLLATLLLIAAFCVPLINLLIAGCLQQTAELTPANIRTRRFALLAVTAPSIYVFFGVLTYMAGTKVPDTWLWTPAWLLFGYLASRSSDSIISKHEGTSARLRIAHGISGAIVALYALFHIFNHMFGIISPESHAAVMEMGRTVYRSKIIEPFLVAAMLFQIFSGLRLVWAWSETSIDHYRMFQIASGVFLSVFILGHMNSVFIFARIWLDIPTDWAFAAGLPTGIIHDAWNIRLLPHYALGVFFMLAHLFSGLRVVMLAHEANVSTANRLWWCGLALSITISATIMCGMTGFRIS